MKLLQGIKPKQGIKLQLDDYLINVISYSVLSIMGIFCIVPFIMLLSGAVSENNLIVKYGFSILPRGFSLNAFSVLFMSPKLITNSYIVTLCVTVIGTILNIYLLSMTAYVLSRKDLQIRAKLSFFFYFTVLFSGGLVPYYILISNYLHLKDNPLVYIVTSLFNVFYIILLRSYIQNAIPDSIMESAKIDGSSDFGIYMKIVLPLMKPALATIALFVALGYWNEWYTNMLFVENEKYFTLQYSLMKMITSFNPLNMEVAQNMQVRDIPDITIKLAMTILSIGPIILAYPFAQRFFVKGIVMGAVKG